MFNNSVVIFKLLPPHERIQIVVQEEHKNLLNVKFYRVRNQFIVLDYFSALFCESLRTNSL
jgi:hypothetical protein